MGLLDILRRKKVGQHEPEVSATIVSESTSPRRDSIETRGSIVEARRLSSQDRRDSARVKELSRPSESQASQLHIREREQFALGVGYGAFQSTLSEVRDRIVEVQKVLDQDIAKERSIEEVSRRLETLSRVYEDHKSAVPPELAEETRYRIEQAGLSTKLMEVYAIVRNRGVVTPAELAAHLNLRPNTCSQYLNELTGRGFIWKVAYGKFAAGADQPEKLGIASNSTRDAT